VLAFFALVLPLVLFPVITYAVDVAVLSTTAAALQAATAQAAEVAAEQIDVGAVRAGAGLTLDPPQASRVAAQVLLEAEPGASVDFFEVVGLKVTLAASERVAPALPLWPGSVTLHALATAVLVSGYDSPSSL